MRAGRVARQLDRVARPPERLVGAAEEPQRERRPVVAGDAGVVAERGRERAVGALVAALLEERDAVLGLLERAREGPLVKEVAGDEVAPLQAALVGAVGRQPRGRVERVAGHGELAAHLVERRQREQQRHQRLVVVEALGQLAGAQQRLLGLGRRPAAGRHLRLAERGQQLDLGARALGPRRQLGRLLERRGEQPDALGVRGARERLVGGELEEAHGRLGLVAGDEVRRDLGRRRPVALERRADAPVQRGAAVGGEAVVEHLAMHVVGEAEASLGPQLDKRAAVGQRQAARRDLGVRALERRGQRRDGELAAGDARGLEQLDLRGRELHQAVLDRRAQALGQAARESAEVGAGEQPLAEPMVEQVAHEQRVAAAALAQQQGQPRRRVADALGKPLRDRGLVERPECQRVAQPAQRELVHERVERSLARAPGAHHEQARRLCAACERDERIERRRVAPMHVFEHEHDGLGRGELLEQLEQLAQHPVARRAASALVQPLELARLDEPGHLDRPRRRPADEQLDDLAASRAVGQPAERVEQRQVGLALAVALETLAARYQPAGLAEERLDQRGLADAGLAGDEDDAPAPGGRRGERGVSGARARARARTAARAPWASGAPQAAAAAVGTATSRPTSWPRIALSSARRWADGSMPSSSSSVRRYAW